MADGDESRRQKDEEEAADQVSDVVSLALGSMCHSFDIDVVTPLCSIDVGCSRDGRTSAVEKVVVCQVGPPNPRPLDAMFTQDSDHLEHMTHVAQCNSCTADGTAPFAVHSAEAGARDLQDAMTEDEQKHRPGTAACYLQSSRVQTTGVQETEVPLDLSQPKVDTSQRTKSTKECEDNEPHMAGPLVTARSTATSPVNVRSHMKDNLVTIETRVPHDVSPRTTEASKSVSVLSGDHTYGATQTDTVTTDYHMAGPNTSARITVTSPVNVTSHMKDGLVTTDSSKTSRVTSSRLSTSENEDENCSHICNDDEGPLDLSPKGQSKKSCGCGNVAETPNCGSVQSNLPAKSAGCSSDRSTADALGGSSDVTNLRDNFESVDLQDTSPLMTSGNTVTDTTCEQPLQLDMLPPEILSHVCVFLDSHFIVTTLSCVCKTLYALFASRAFWKGRLYRRWQNKFPAVPVDEDTYDWREACIGCEAFLSRWSHHEDTMAHLKFTRSVFASVDAVHLMQNARFLVAGSRDRYLNVFDLGSIDLNRPETVNDSLVFSTMNAHQGWIWSLSSVDNVLATGSWDMMVKFWDLDVGQCVQFVRCQSALLCSHLEAGFYVAGAFNWRMYHIDPRMSSIVAVKKYHTHPVLCLAADDRYIISGSEDRTVCVYDRRADGLVKTLKLDSYPMCMSYSDNQLWLGDKTGQVHLVDATQGSFNVVKTYDVGHTGKLTGIRHTQGGVFTCCTDKTVKVLEPTSRLETICTIVSDNCAVARIDYKNGVLASANSNMSISVLLPRRQLTS